MVERATKRIQVSRKADPFGTLPDDLLISILSKLSSSASSPSDLINSLQVCKRFNQLGVNRFVLSVASSAVFTIPAKNWSDSAHLFVKLCADSGSVDASYFLGMITFYCLGNRGGGAALMTKAAIRRHAPALYSLAVIQFNGSGGPKTDKDLRAGVALCARAAYNCHVDARRELGHCLQDGYGVRRKVSEGRRLLVQANALELAAARKLNRPTVPGLGACMCSCSVSGLECELLSDYGCNVPMQELHASNRFLIEWFVSKEGLLGPGLGLCSHAGCWRPETRPHEFRRCSACGSVKYCSRGCQAHDWKLRHKERCRTAADTSNEQDNEKFPFMRTRHVLNFAQMNKTMKRKCVV